MRWVVLLLFATCCAPSSPLPTIPSRPCSYPRLPLRVALESDLSWEAVAYQRAFDTWEQALGVRVFEHGVGLGVDVVVLGGIDHPKPETMATAHRWRGFSGACVGMVVERRQMRSDEEAYIFAVHELGHLLGVGHAVQGRSFMSPILDVKLGEEWFELDEGSLLAARLGLGL